MATRDEILRFLVETKGEQELRSLAREILLIGDAGSKSEAELKGLLDQVIDADRLAKAAAGYRETAKAVRESAVEFQGAQKRVTDFVQALAMLDIYDMSVPIVQTSEIK